MRCHSASLSSGPPFCCYGVVYAYHVPTQTHSHSHTQIQTLGLADTEISYIFFLSRASIFRQLHSVVLPKLPEIHWNPRYLVADRRMSVGTMSLDDQKVNGEHKMSLDNFEISIQNGKLEDFFCLNCQRRWWNFHWASGLFPNTSFPPKRNASPKACECPERAGESTVSRRLGERDKYLGIYKLNYS